MKLHININSAGSGEEKYYDHNDLLEENVELVIPFISKYVDVPKLRDALGSLKHMAEATIKYVGHEFYQILYLVVKRNSIFSHETIQDKVKRKLEAYKEAHHTGQKYVDLFVIFRAMYAAYAATAAEIAGIDYRTIPAGIRHEIEKELYTQIGVTG